MERDYKIIVADTNWWVSLVIKKFDNKFAETLQSIHLKFVTSTELTEEIRSTLSKERLQKHLNQDVVNSFWYLYGVFVTTIEVTSTVSVCRDPKDNFLLALARDSNADFLITGDKDLLVLEKYETTIICTLTDFINKYLK
jgi:uncharacterized protein